MSGLVSASLRLAVFLLLVNPRFALCWKQISQQRIVSNAAASLLSKPLVTLRLSGFRELNLILYILYDFRLRPGFELLKTP